AALATAGCPRTASYVGALTGTVLDDKAAPAAGAFVYLAGGNASSPGALYPTAGNSGTPVSQDGRFYLQIDAGNYAIVATLAQPQPTGTPVDLAYYQDVTVEGGAVTDLGVLALKPCGASYPCPPNPMPTPTGTPVPAGGIAYFQPDVVTATRVVKNSTVPSSDDL